MSIAGPMEHRRRLRAYWQQTGTPAGDRLTPRQRRRAQHKRNHAAAPFGKRAK